MVTCSEEKGDRFVMVRLYNDGEEGEEMFVAKEEKELEILARAGSLPFYTDINKDGFTDIVFNDLEETLSISLWDSSSTSFLPPTSFSSILHPSSPCKTLPPLSLQPIHSSLSADLNNDCISDLYLELQESRQSPNSAILIAIQVKDQIKYCPMDMDQFDLSDISGLVTADFDGDGLMDLAGFND